MTNTWKKWIKTALVAAVGGAITATFAALLDPQNFSFQNGLNEKHIAEMALEGAMVALAGLLLQSPFGKQMIAEYQQSQAAVGQAKATLASEKKPPAAK